MTTRDLIERLRGLDPTGDLHVVLPDMENGVYAHIGNVGLDRSYVSAWDPTNPPPVVDVVYIDYHRPDDEADTTTNHH